MNRTLYLARMKSFIVDGRTNMKIIQKEIATGLEFYTLNPGDLFCILPQESVYIKLTNHSTNFLDVFNLTKNELCGFESHKHVFPLKGTLTILD